MNPLFLIAILPNLSIQLEVTSFKQECAQLFQASHALKTPPHITLLPPFRWPVDKLDDMKTALNNFAQEQLPLPVGLDGFGCFPPRVVFVDVPPNEPLEALQVGLEKYLSQTIGLKNKKAQAFRPHMTIAHRDLTEEAFPAAWAHFSEKIYERPFLVADIVLLRHMDGRWQVVERFGFRP